MKPIIALSTSLNICAIGIIRISFGSLNINFNFYFLKIFKKRLKHRYATYVNFYYKGSILDNGIAIFFKKPFSYTGENVLEFHGHGNYLNLNYILKAFLIIFKKYNIRLAYKGEFTKRAFLNKKINLIDVNNLLNLFNSKNVFSLKNVHINLTNKDYLKLKKIYNIIIYLDNFLKNVSLNFKNINKLKCKLFYLLKKIFNIYKRFDFKSENDFIVVFLGSPNTGKSTIINKLINKKYLIVSSIPGTTRDVVNCRLSIDNNFFNIYDTAGLRKTYDKLENIGIKYAFNKIKDSKFVFYVLDYKFKKNFFKKIFNFISKYSIFILIFNKIDLFNDFVNFEIFIFLDFKNIVFKISAKRKLGINFVYIKLNEFIYKNKFVNTDNYYFKHIKKIYFILINSFNFNKKNYLENLSYNINLLISYINKIFFNRKLKINKIFKKFCLGK